MGLFQRSGIKILASSFAISTDDSKQNETKQKDRIIKAKNSVDAAMRKQSQLESAEIKNTDVSPVMNLKETIQVTSKMVGIADVVRLVRSLPNKGTDAELYAVLQTLSMFDVNIESLLDESERKESLTKNRITVLKEECIDLKNQVLLRENEIAILEVGLEEMEKVNLCLNKMADLQQRDFDGVETENAGDNQVMKTVQKNTKKTEAKKKVAKSKRAAIEKESKKVAQNEVINESYSEDSKKTQEVINLDVPPQSKKRSKTTKKRTATDSA